MIPGLSLTLKSANTGSVLLKRKKSKVSVFYEKQHSECKIKCCVVDVCRLLNVGQTSRINLGEVASHAWTTNMAEKPLDEEQNLR
jgi:hypothetical protein